MSFKFFRKHERAMLWIIVVITILTFSIFSVTSTMETCFRRAAVDVGVFTSHSGAEVPITQRMYKHTEDLLRHFYQGNDGLTDDMIFTHIIMDHEAEAAGIHVSDEEFRAQFGKAVKSKEEYFALIQRLGFSSATKFEEGWREMVKVEKLQRFLTLNDNLILSEDLYNEYKLENEEFKLAYIPFPYDHFKAEIEAQAVVDEDLQTYFDGLTVNHPDVVEHFSIPEKFAFDVAYIDLSQANVEDYADLVKDVAVEDADLIRLHGMTKERFLVASVEEEPTPVEEGEEAPVAEPAPQYREWNEPDVRAQLEAEFKLAKIVENASIEWTTYAREEKIIDKKPEVEPPAEDESVEAKAGPSEKFAEIVKKFNLTLMEQADLISLDDLATMETFGSDMLKQRMKYLKLNNAVYFRPDGDRPALPFFVRVTERLEREKKALAEVREKAVERYQHKQMLERSEKAAREFLNELKEKVRVHEEVQEFITVLTEGAQADAEAKIASQGEVTEAVAAKIRADALKLIEPDIENLLMSKLHLAFDEQAAVHDYTVITIDYYSKATTREPEFYQLDDSPEKFLKSNRTLLNLDTNGVADPLNDTRGESWYVAQVLDRRFPAPDSMTEDDYLSMKKNIEMRKMYERRQGTMGMKEDPFSFDKVAKEYNLRFYKAAESEDEAPDVVPVQEMGAPEEQVPAEAQVPEGQ